VSKHVFFFVTTLVILSTAAFIAVGQTTEPWLGTWKINLATSTYSPGPKPTVGATVKVEPAQGGFKTTIDGVNANGQPIHTENVSQFDGKDTAVAGAPTPKTTAGYRRIDERTFESVAKVDGKVTVTTRVVVSADGKTETVTQTGKNPQGQTVNNILILEKQ
jgi:hypothetical protein